MDPEPKPLTQALDRARRLHELLQEHQADLLQHAESAAKSTRPEASAKSGTQLTEPILQDGVRLTRRAADAAGRLLDGLVRAERDERASP